MNRFVKVTVAALAVAASVSVFAADEKEIFKSNHDEVIGWTPVCVGLATPVQLPFGMNKWDVYGLDLGLLFVDVPELYGVNLAGLAAMNRNEIRGVQFAGIANFSQDKVYGIRAAFGFNIAQDDVYGVEIGGFGLRKNFCGLGVEFLGSFQRTLTGCALSGLVSINMDEVTGAVVAIGGNVTEIATGCMVAGCYNHAEELHGCQIGLVNYCNDCQEGFQIGLVNIIMSNQVPFLPFVNGCF